MSSFSWSWNFFSDSFSCSQLYDRMLSPSDRCFELSKFLQISCVRRSWFVANSFCCLLTVLFFWPNVFWLKLCEPFSIISSSYFSCSETATWSKLLKGRTSLYLLTYSSDPWPLIWLLIWASSPNQACPLAFLTSFGWWGSLLSVEFL